MECLQESDLGQNTLNSKRAKSPKATLESTYGSSLHCNICREPAKDRMVLLLHLAQHKFGLLSTPRNFTRVPAGINPFFCNLCGDTFCTRNDLQCHLKQQSHSSDDSFHCIQCKRNFLSLAALKTHVEYIHLVNKLLCDKCDRIFSSVTEMHLHNLCHGISNECPECCLQLEELSTLSSHLEFHVPVLFYSCNYCPLIFSSHGSVLAHLVSHTTSLEPADCYFCIAMPLSESFVGYHSHEISSITGKRRKYSGRRDILHNIKCAVRPSEVVKQPHSSMDSPVSDESGVRLEDSLQGCSVEISGTSNTSNMVSETIHVKIEPFDSETEPPESAAVNVTHHSVPLKCEDCNLSFLTEKELLHHKSLHKMKGDFSCIECGEYCESSENLNTHYEEHLKKEVESDVDEN